ncbi:hypothetical protein MBOE_52090 [Mycolicibacterium boenickei]|uniref:Uncharacterized protein n=1 Tax=Mycolicibacterium boenickei TaxID=146017 RepID=A0ABN5ZHM2_9MYCO|nr:hypothetical protein MBOE_52090 [Mycolicibacterium boenickei]
MQRLIGEQPPTRVVELGRSPAPQLYGLHQDSGPVTELRSDRGNVADQAGSGKAALGDLSQGLGSRRRTQIRDV